MKSKSCKSSIWLLASIMTLAILTSTILVTAKCQISVTQTTSVYLDPPEILFLPDEVPVGHGFNVTAWVSDVTDLFGYQVTLYYNSTVINMNKALLPSTDTSYVFYGQSGIPIAPSYGGFDDWGYCVIGFTGLPGVTPLFSGTGKLSIFEFEVIALPTVGNLTSDLIISYPVGGPEFETKLKDSAGGTMDVTATDGQYVYMSSEAPPPPPEGTQLYVDPPEIILNTYEVSVGYLFNVTAWISNVTDLYGYQVALFYNASVINMTSASLPEDHVLAGQFSEPLGPVYAYFDSWGVCLIGFTCISDATPFSGYGKLAEFEFEIVASPPEGGNLTSYLVISPENSPPYPSTPQGGTYKTKLVDSAALPIEFNATDGYFEYSWISALIGDLNGDGFVNMDDLVIAVLSFGSYPEHPRWNPIADLNKDGIVDIYDIVTIAIHFGEQI